MFQTTTLANGITVGTVRTTGALGAVAVYVDTGSSRETETQHGVAHFLEHMAFKGTPTRTAIDISRQIEQTGCHINAMTSKTSTIYYVAGLGKHLPKSLNILSDILTNSLMAPDDIAMEREVIMREYEDSAGELAYLVQMEHDELSFGANSIGRSIIGTADSILSIDRDMLLDYMSRFYVGKNIFVGAAGEFEHDEFVKMVEDRFGGMPAGEKAPPLAGLYGGGARVLNDNRGMGLSQVTMSYFTQVKPKAGEIDMGAFLSLMLGFGASSPMFNELREKRGLCYDAACEIIRHPFGSQVVMMGTTTPKQTNEFLKVSRGELEKIAEGDIRGEDIDRTINSALVHAAMQDNDPNDLLSSAIVRYFDRGVFSVPDVTQYEKILTAVTPAEIARTAETLLESCPTLVVGGAFKKSFAFE